MANPDGIVDLKDDWAGPTIAITADSTDVDPIAQFFNDTAKRANQLADAMHADLDFTVDPGLAEYILNQPTGIESFVPTVPFGRYRLTAPATVSDVNLRTLRTAGKAGVMGDSEVRSTWYAQSTAMSDSQGRFQPGHSHRVTAAKQVTQRGTATSGAGTTISNSAGPWTANQFAGVNAFQVQYYVTIIGGTGIGQTRKIVSNTTTAITVDSAWTTNPASGSIYEIWSYNVRAITFSQNIVFNAHAILNLHVWDGSAFNAIGQVDMGAYLKPGGVYVQFPWFVKTRVRGRTAEIAVWKGSDPETAYGTSGRSASFALPDTHDQPGASGLYLGHLQANDWMEFENLQVVHL